MAGGWIAVGNPPRGQRLANRLDNLVGPFGAPLVSLGGRAPGLHAEELTGRGQQIGDRRVVRLGEGGQEAQTQGHRPGVEDPLIVSQDLDDLLVPVLTTLVVGHLDHERPPLSLLDREERGRVEHEVDVGEADRRPGWHLAQHTRPRRRERCAGHVEQRDPERHIRKRGLVMMSDRQVWDERDAAVRERVVHESCVLDPHVDRQRWSRSRMT